MSVIEKCLNCGWLTNNTSFEGHIFCSHACFLNHQAAERLKMVSPGISAKPKHTSDDKINLHELKDELENIRFTSEIPLRDEEMVSKQSAGLKYDQGKSRLDLLSGMWLKSVGDVLAFGADKYAAHNWRKGIILSKLLGACQRHILAFQDGEDIDPESGLSHLAHASCCLMFMSELYKTMPAKIDDRYKVGKNDQSK